MLDKGVDEPKRDFPCVKEVVDSFPAAFPDPKRLSEPKLNGEDSTGLSLFAPSAPVVFPPPNENPPVEENIVRVLKYNGDEPQR